MLRKSQESLRRIPVLFAQPVRKEADSPFTSVAGALAKSLTIGHLVDKARSTTIKGPLVTLSRVAQHQSGNCMFPYVFGIWGDIPLFFTSFFESSLFFLRFRTFLDFGLETSWFHLGIF